MKKFRWQILIVVLALIAIGILLIGQQPTILPGVAPVIEPEPGGEYAEALVGSLGRLNPVLDAFNPPDQDVDRLVFSSLVKFDSNGLPHGDLADTWGISRDGTTYSFSIRPGAVWHDGAPVTADDVVFTIDLLRSEEIPTSPDIKEFWKQVEVHAVDQNTLQFVLPEPFAPFFDYLTFGVLPKHILEGLTPQEIIEDPYNLAPVGSGPYRFERLLAEDGSVQGVTLSVFPDYYGQKPFIEQVTFRYYPDPAAAAFAYQQGQVQGLSQLTPDILSEGLAAPDLNVYTGRLPRVGLLYLNLKDPSLPFFQEREVRRALLLGLNRQWIIDRILGGQAVLADGPVLPGTWAAYEGIERLPYDPEAAIAMLKKAGYIIPAEGGDVRAKEGVRLEFELAYPQGGDFQAIAESIQRDWARLGVKVNLVAAPYEQLLADYLEPRRYQAALAELDFSSAPDPDPYPFWHQAQITNGQNYSGWDDRQASEFLERARVVDDYGERARLYRNFQVRWANEMPALPLYHPVYSYGVDQAVQGVRVGPLFELPERFNTLPGWFLLARTTAAGLETPTP